MSIANSFLSWWRRRMAPNYVYEDEKVVRKIIRASQLAYVAGWLAAKREK